MNKCPNCGHEWKDEGRSKGGYSKGPTKGFGSPHVLAKALETRRRNAEARRLAAQTVTEKSKKPTQPVTNA